MAGTGEGAGGATALRNLLCPFFAFFCLSWPSVAAVAPAASDPCGDLGRAPYAGIDSLYLHRNIPGRLDGDLRLIARALRHGPDNPALLWREGRALVRRGEASPSVKQRRADFSRARDILSASVRDAPRCPQAHYWLGLSLGLLGREDGLIKSAFLIAPLKRQMKAVIRLDPRDGRPHRVLGELYESLPRMLGGGLGKALGEFQTAASLSPRDSSARLALAQAYRRRGMRAQARAELESIVQEKNPLDPAEYADDLKEARKLLLAF